MEHLRRPDLSVGTYSLRAGAADLQEPHTEDEVYVVTARPGEVHQFRRDDRRRGRLGLLRGRNEVHRFHDIEADLSVLVFFGPAEVARRAASA